MSARSCTAHGGHSAESRGEHQSPRVSARAARPGTAAALLACALALIAALSQSVAAPAHARAAAAPRCATSTLVMWVNPDGGGTAGSYYYHVEIANQSRRSCSLRGYPGVSAVDLRDRRVGRPAAREVTGTPATVTLAPGAHTSAIVRATDVGALPPGSCRPAAVAGFRVYPPGNTVSKVVPFPLHACSGPEGSLRVRAVLTEEGY
jgi:Domain of unknown function (DUF4232)